MFPPSCGKFPCICNDFVNIIWIDTPDAKTEILVRSEVCGCQNPRKSYGHEIAAQTLWILTAIYVRFNATANTAQQAAKNALETVRSTRIIYSCLCDVGLDLPR